MRLHSDFCMICIQYTNGTTGSVEANIVLARADVVSWLFPILTSPLFIHSQTPPTYTKKKNNLYVVLSKLVYRGCCCCGRHNTSLSNSRLCLRNSARLSDRANFITAHGELTATDTTSLVHFGNGLYRRWASSWGASREVCKQLERKSWSDCA